MTLDTIPAWDLRPAGWRLRIHGDAPFDIAAPLPVSLDVLAPGILTTEDLPIILPRGPRRTAE